MGQHRDHRREYDDHHNSNTNSGGGGGSKEDEMTEKLLKNYLQNKSSTI